MTNDEDDIELYQFEPYDTYDDIYYGDDLDDLYPLRSYMTSMEEEDFLKIWGGANLDKGVEMMCEKGFFVDADALKLSDFFWEPYLEELRFAAYIDWEECDYVIPLEDVIVRTPAEYLAMLDENSLPHGVKRVQLFDDFESEWSRGAYYGWYENELALGQELAEVLARKSRRQKRFSRIPGGRIKHLRARIGNFYPHLEYQKSKSLEGEARIALKNHYELQFAVYGFDDEFQELRKNYRTQRPSAPILLRTIEVKRIVRVAGRQRFSFDQIHQYCA